MFLITGPRKSVTLLRTTHCPLLWNRSWQCLQSCSHLWGSSILLPQWLSVQILILTKYCTLTCKSKIGVRMFNVLLSLVLLTFSPLFQVALSIHVWLEWDSLTSRWTPQVFDASGLLNTPTKVKPLLVLHAVTYVKTAKCSFWTWRSEGLKEE